MTPSGLSSIGTESGGRISQTLTEIYNFALSVLCHFTNVRGNYLAECPNAGLLFKNVKFSVPIVTDWLDYQQKNSSSPKDTAKAWLKANAAEVKTWLAGVTTADGKDGFEAVPAALAAN